MSFQIGDSIGDYQIISILGAGGMGKVYKVKNLISDRVDAIKVLLPNLADDPELADRFIREIKVLASLNHPNIAGLRTAFRLDNQLLMVMEYVEGTSLDERCKAGPIPLADSINYIQQALAALGYAHKHGVIHRDIKPANMMLTPDGVVKLMDFGIAKSKSDKKLTQTGTTMGSLFYMSAEQVQGNELDGRADLYSLGVSLYEMVTGSRPFQGKSDFDIMIAQMQQTPQAPIQMMPDLPKALNDIIMISLEKDPANRFQTAEAFSAALGSIGDALNQTPAQAAVGGMPVTQVPPAPSMPSLSTQPVAVGGVVPATGGYTPTANVPTVTAPRATAATMPPAAMAAAPVPMPVSSAPAPAASKGYRGLYMALGALIVVAVLAGAAIEVPRFMHNPSANATPSGQVGAGAPNSVAPTTPTSGTGSSPATGVAGSVAGSSGTDSNPAGTASGITNGAPNGGSPSMTAPASGGMISAASSTNPRGNTIPGTKPLKNHTPGMNQAASGEMNGGTPVASGAGQGAQTAPVANGVSAQELAELHKLHEQLQGRVFTANQAVDNMRKSIPNIRGDIAAAQNRMQHNMSKADAAMTAGNPEDAKEYMDLAEKDCDKLEDWLGLH